MDWVEEAKKGAAVKAVGYVKDSMVVGLGTGSTVEYMLRELASRIKKKKLTIKGGIPSSVKTEKLARRLGIPLTSLDSHPKIDLTIDGADEANLDDFTLIKGGGGALAREKIIASAAKKFIVAVDESKLVKTLGVFPVPIEVIPFAKAYVIRELKSLGGRPKVREGFRTDNGNIILDTKFPGIRNPEELEFLLNNIPGVVENGIFAARTPDVIVVGYKEKPKS